MIPTQRNVMREAIVALLIWLPYALAFLWSVHKDPQRQLVRIFLDIVTNPWTVAPPVVMLPLLALCAWNLGARIGPLGLGLTWLAASACFFVATLSHGADIPRDNLLLAIASALQFFAAPYFIVASYFPIFALLTSQTVRYGFRWR